MTKVSPPPLATEGEAIRHILQSVYDPANPNKVVSEKEYSEVMK